ncbi:MAG TPA: hypothetical protein VNA69_09860 [Thermoanaerobaculia bacterium]|nr:hypothetical protein [Thermoanaerobaculia bacterium]
MRAFTADDVLTAAERLRAEPPPRRAAAILALATGMPRGEAMALPIGERDDRLLALRIATFGREMIGVIDCPACGEPCETIVDAAALRIDDDGGRETVEVTHGDWRVRARLPNTDDVAEAAAVKDAVVARRLLLERCIVERSGDGELPDELVDALEEEMERADPRGDIRLALVCPQCARPWSAAFDVAGFFWIEVNAAAKRLVQEVDILARTYGWSERDILGMPVARRRTYIEKCLE